MNKETPMTGTFRLLICTGALALALATPAAAQDDATRTAEIAELETLLQRTDAALAALEPLISEDTRFVQYDIRQLMYRPKDRAAPALSMHGQNSGFRTGGGGGMLSFDSGDQLSGLFQPDQIESMIVQGVGEDDWDDPRSIEVNRGYLLIRQTDLGHARIATVLAELQAGLLRTVQLEVGFYRLPPELQDQVDEAALAADGVLPPETLAQLDAWSQAGQASLVASGMLSCLNEQRVFLHHGRERTYVSDYERSSGGTGVTVETVSDPIVSVLRSGLALDVCPTVLSSAGGLSVSLDVNFVRATPVASTRHATPWGPLEAARMNVDSVRTSARVPTGSGMLVFSSRGSGADEDGAGLFPADVTIVVRPIAVE
ncbi:hypothetical protein OAX78_02860 [Planctomycetota bacterium]|nr:hypothetical protein [Planctomycetota bacterium]